MKDITIIVLIGFVSSSFCAFETKCSSREGERQGQLAGAAWGQAGAVMLRKEAVVGTL